jgi:tetratricopeptide (TPR) repeat protein
MDPATLETWQERHHDAVERRSAAMKAGDKEGHIVAARDAGIALFEMDQLGLAEKLLGEALRVAESSGLKRELLPGLHGMLGRTSQRRKRWEEALERYRTAASLAKEQGLEAEHLRWAGKEARTLLDVHQREPGLTKLEASVALGRELAAKGEPVAEEFAEQLGRLASEVAEDGDSERGEKLWAEALEQLGRVERGPAHFFASLSYASFLAARGRHALAITYLDEARELGHALALPSERMFNVVQTLAALLRETDPRRAGDVLMEELPRVDDPRMRHELLTLAVDHFFAGRAWERMVSAGEGLVELRQLGGTHKGRWDAEMRLSIAYRELGRTDEALAHLERAEAHARDSGDPQALTDARGQLALVLVDRHEFAKAAQFATALWDEGSRHRLLARTLVQAFAGLGELDRAESFRDAFAASGGGAMDVSWMKAVIADAGRGDPIQAWHDVGVAGGTDPEVQAEALSRLFRLHPAGSVERFEVARARLRLIDRARQQVADIFSESSWRAVTGRASEFPTWLDEFLDAASEAKRQAEAVYELERFRSQALVDLLATRAMEWRKDEEGRLGVKSQAEDRYARARARLEGLVALGAGWRERREAAEQVDLYKSMALSAGGLIHFKRGHAGFFFPQSLEKLLEGAGLGSEEVLLFIHVGVRSHMWAVDQAGQVRHRPLPEVSAGDIAEVSGFVWGRAAMPDGMARGGNDVRGYRDVEPLEEESQLATALETLDGLLAGPIVAWAAELKARRVFLSGGTGLWALPIDCCPSMLKAGLEVAFLPSAQALGFSRITRWPRARGGVYIVDPQDIAAIMKKLRGKAQVVLDPTETLHFAGLEAAFAATALPGYELQVLGPDGVDKKQLIHAASSAGAFHFIGHGTFDDASPYRSGVYLARSEGVLTVAEIFSDVDAPAGRLAVLSGCATGRVRSNLVSEQISLPAAMIAAGFTAVVSSRWAVDDFSTALLMGELYRRWSAGGISISAALRDSAEWLRTLSREGAIELLRALPERLAAAASPVAAASVADACAQAVEHLSNGPEAPFEKPERWAAFFVAGDGAITAG